MSVASFGNIFSHSAGHLFVSLMVSFAVKMLLSLVRSYLFLLVFISNYSRRQTEKDTAAISVREKYSAYIFP